jgi:hypothetical protein
VRTSVGPFRAAALAVVSLVGGAAFGDEREGVFVELAPERFYVPPLDERGRPTHVVLRIVDDATGAAIPGATAALHAQTECPITGLVPSDRTDTADAEGWVRIRGDDLGWEPTWTGAYWKYVEAPGYGGVAVGDGRIDGEVRLSRARGHVVEVRDALDRPVAGALVGARSARTCGHMPDQRLAVSYAQGLATFTAMGPAGADYDAMGWELWVAAPSIRGDYHDVVLSAFPGPPQALRHLPSRPIEGVVVDPAGEPIAGADVGTHDGGHRGPWCRSGADGTFRLIGAPPFAHMIALRNGEPWDRRVEFTAPPWDVKRRVTLPVPGGTLEAEKPHEVEIELVDAGGEDVDPLDAGLVAVREEDGATVRPRGWSSLPGLPPGTWTLSAGGDLSPWAPARATLVVPDVSAEDGPAEDGMRPTASLRLTQQPLLRVRLDAGPGKTSVTLLSDAEDRWVTADELAAGALALGTDLDCTFRVTVEDLEQVVHVPVPRGPRVDEPLVLRAPRALLVKAVLEDEAGRPVMGWLVARPERLLDGRDLPDGLPEGEPTQTPTALETRDLTLPGAVLDVLAVPEPAELLARRVRMPVPSGALVRGELDLGRVTLGSRGDRRLRVVDRAGALLAPHGLRRVRGDVVREWASWSEEVAPLDSRIDPFAEGDVVEVDAAWTPEGAEPVVRSSLPVRARLEGPGPWTIGPPADAATLVLDARDEEGRPIAATLLLDGAPFPFYAHVDDDGRVAPRVLENVPPGVHRVAVAAENRITQAADVTLRAGERRVVAVRLRPAPSTAASR